VASSALLHRLVQRQASHHHHHHHHHNNTGDDNDDEGAELTAGNDTDDDDEVTNIQAAPSVAVNKLRALTVSRAACKRKLDVCVAKSGF
jgi:hypothetical protein